MDEIPLSGLPADDPKNDLSEPARRRIQDARLEGEKIRARALAVTDARFQSEPDREDDFIEYCCTGQAALELTEAKMQAARTVLSVMTQEFRMAGKSRRELCQIMRDELEGAVYSLALTSLQRDLLWMELDLYKSGPTEQRNQTPSSAEPAEAEASSRRLFRKEGEYWTLIFEGKTVRLRDGKGVRYLSYLVSQPGRDVHALSLVGAVGGSLESSTRSSAGEVLDERAMADYKARAESIQHELGQARNHNDLGRMELLEEEFDRLTAQLTSATGLGGRRRTLGDNAERARKAVSRAVTRTIEQIRTDHKDLADHFAKHVSLGGSLSYRGDGIGWNS